jgi:hypothetical protein
VSLRIQKEKESETEGLANFSKMRDEAVAEFDMPSHAAGEDGRTLVGPGPNTIPGSVARLFQPGVDPDHKHCRHAWLHMAVASTVQAILASDDALHDVGTSTLYYKVPTKPGSGVSKIWCDQTAPVKLWFLGKISTATCGVATGSKMLCRLGPLPLLGALSEGMSSRSSFFAVPTSNMLTPQGFDKVPAWMVRAVKPKDKEGADAAQEAPTMICNEFEVSIPGNALWPDFSVTLKYLCLNPDLDLAPSVDGRPNLLELTRPLFEEEKRPAKNKSEGLSKFMEAPMKPIKPPQTC